MILWTSSGQSCISPRMTAPAPMVCSHHKKHGLLRQRRVWGWISLLGHTSFATASGLKRRKPSMKASQTVLQALLVAAGATLWVPALANDCDAVASASLKQTGVPYRSEMTITAPGQAPQKAQAVYMVTKLYTQVDGKWNAVPVSAQQMSQQIESSIKNGNVTCKKVGSEQVGGEAATVFATHGVQQGNTVDTKTWIS